MLKTKRSLKLRKHAWTLSKSIPLKPKSVAGARNSKLQSKNGSGSKMKRSGTNTTMETGITGAHPRLDSLPLDGPGIRATGIMVDMSSNSIKTTGIDSKEASGSSMVKMSQSSLKYQEVHRSVDHSTC